MENDKIKDLFSSKLGSFEPEVPASVWGGLDQLLSNQPAPSADPGSSSSSSSSATSGAGNASIIKTVAIAVGLSAAVAAGILFIPGEDMVEDKKEEAKIIEETSPAISEQIADTAQIIPDIPIAIKGVPKIYAAAKVEKEAAVETGQGQEIEEFEQPMEKEVQPKEEEKKVEETLLAADEEMAPQIKILKGGFSLGVKAGANLFAENLNQQGSNILFSRDDRSTIFMEALDRENANYKLRHKQPLSLGITVGKKIFPRLSLETGLVYTYLSSEIISDSQYNINESQNFHYLGIPLYLNYTLYDKNKLKFYISVGGMIQKDIKGKYTSDVNFFMDDVQEAGNKGELYYAESDHVEKSIKQNNPQFSLHTSIGVAYPLYKKLYLYGTIGGAYYFDAGNAYRTIYSDRKFQLNLNTGLKFDF